MITKFFNRIKVNFHLNINELKETNVIYLLKFPNEKYYVGQTCNKLGLINRICHHCYEATNENKKRNWYKDHIIRKYKYFDVFILRKCTKENIDEFEIFYINILKNKLINLEKGGSLNKEISSETKLKISQKLKSYNEKNQKIVNIQLYDLKGEFIKTFKYLKDAISYFNCDAKIIHTACKRKSIFLKQYQLYYNYDCSPIDFTKKINENGNIKKWKRFIKINGIKTEITKIYQYNENGIFEKEYDIISINDKELENIKMSIKRNSFYKNSIWSWEKLDKITPPKKRYAKVSEKLSNPIYQLNDKLEIMKEWKNTKEAGKYYNCNDELIRQVCIRWRKHCHGFVWCYKKDYEEYKKLWGTPLVRRRSDTKKGRKAMGLE